MYTLIKNWQDLVTKTAAAPFERIKILLQVQVISINYLDIKIIRNMLNIVTMQLY